MAARLPRLVPPSTSPSAAEGHVVEVKSMGTEFGPLPIVCLLWSRVRILGSASSYMVYRNYIRIPNYGNMAWIVKP